MSSRLCKIKIPASVIAIDVIAFGDSYDIVSVIFEDAEGWVVTDSKTGEVIELSAEELSDPVIAAEYISNIYKWSYWNKTN